jgi:uncharacterized protein
MPLFSGINIASSLTAKLTTLLLILRKNKRSNMGRKKVTRRDFIQSSMTAALVVPSLELAAPTVKSTKMPTRKLGKTGLDVPLIAFGCGTRFLMYKDEEEALRVLSHAIDIGINYLDTAAQYGNGKSEERIGRLMKTRRKDVILQTKIPEVARTRDEALREVEKSLKRLQTDRLDILHIHSLMRDDDLAKIEAKDGALKALYELRDQKVARFVGVTSHTSGEVLAKAIERHDLDCVQMAMNPALTGKFETHALPAAKKKNVGVIVMKVSAQGKLVGNGAGKSDYDSLLRYGLSLPVSVASLGMPDPKFIDYNADIARKFTPLTTKEADQLRVKISPSQASLEEFFRSHRDCLNHSV